MSDSSNPSVAQQNEGRETEPYGGDSSASSLGAPAPDAEVMDGPATDDLEGTDRDVADESDPSDPDQKKEKL
jgi:hypothetical protein